MDFPNGTAVAPDVDYVSELNTWLTSLQDGTVAELAPRDYVSDDTLRIQGQTGIHIAGMGATITRKVATRGTMVTKADRTWSLFEAKDAGNVSMEHLSLIGANTTISYRSGLEAQHGISLQGCEGFQADDITVSATFGDGFCLAPFQGFETTDVDISGCEFSGLGRQGWSFTGCRRVEVSDCKLELMTHSVMDFEPVANAPGWGAWDVMVRDCEFGTGGTYWLAGLGIGPLEGLTVRDCELHGIGMTMKVAEQSRPVPIRRGPIELIGNKSDTPVSMGIAPFYLRWIDGLIIAGNVQPFNPARPQIATYLPGCVSPIVLWNSFPGAQSVVNLSAYPTQGPNALTDVSNIKENQLVQGGPYDQPAQ